MTAARDVLKKKMTVTALAAWLIVPAPASAQIVRPSEAASIQWGPLSLYPSLKIADLGVDTNIYNDAAEPERDFTMTVMSRMLSVVQLGESSVMASAGSDYVWFRDHAAERSSNGVYAVRLNLSTRRLKPFVGAEILHTRARATAEIDARAQRT